ncbi:PTS IIA-like nitrogen regulatory protein PtsN [Brumicola nitratireducens]|jgi:PTS system nitrogen regulatory IIA component|uniref:Nitrogen regulatory IIA protein n=1 Tax=Glaciecola nitratireducens (strain JCM 12485 / KCTC 12276 / FR1064) TaxID=1085623 RepID=G4QJY0_GLANF|nr:PTS IIA-like nitrogen regulatory protein PtsN [Glaciecola nitratireducens]AEP29022.1 nitrogen regulatory IIA protein [Glaciecola nitratireducens FR1064]
MIISDIISLDRTECAVECQSKKRIFEVISEIAVKGNPQLNLNDVLASMLAREKMGSTGIGNGIAIPHGRIEGIQDIVAIIVTSEEPIQFDAIDDKPVDIFFALLVPSEQTQEHLQTLSSIAQKLSDKNIVKALRNAATRDEIISALA